MQRKPSKLEYMIERIIFASRWLQAPMYLAMLSILFAFIYISISDIFHLFQNIRTLTESDLIVASLNLADLILIANLVVIVVVSGYENFVSRLDLEHDEGEPIWLKKIDHTAVKIKISSSIVAISSIQLLKVYFQLSKNSGSYDFSILKWTIFVHLTFIVSGLFLAGMSWVQKRI